MSSEPPRASEILGGDHRELDRVFEEFQACPLPDRERRRALFERFAVGLRHHIALEEQQLFPLFGEGDAGRRQQVERLLEEHRRIEEALEALSARLSSSGGSTGELETALLDVLWEHNAREEGAVYPWLDTALSPDALRRLATQLARESERSDP